MQVLTDKERKGWKVLLYGCPGIGKSTLANQAPKPVFLDCEDGVSRYGFARTPLVKSYDEVITHLRDFFKSEYETIVVDTMDFLEVLLHEQVCKDNHIKSMEALGYGKSYVYAQEKWIALLNIFEMLTSAKKNILCIGHEQIKSYNAPDMESYDRYNIKLNAKSANLIVARMDAVLFAQWETLLVKDKGKDDRKFARGTGDRVLRTKEDPAWIAKSRFNLGDVEPMDGTIFAKFNK